MNTKTVLIFVVLWLMGCTYKPQAEVEAEARAFGKAIGWDIAGASCSGRDSDGDGYVTCSIGVREGDKIRAERLECAIWEGSRDGCKQVVPPPAVQINNSNGQ